MTEIVQLSDHIQAKAGRDPLTMSSLEIAELLSPDNPRHDNVRRTIERLAEAGVFSLPPLEDVKVQRERRAETVSVYQLNKRSSLIVVAQLSPEFTARVVDRWQELEAKIAQPQAIPTTAEAFAHAFTMLAQTFERFAGECNPVTPYMFTHPFIEGRFRCARATGAA
ncbi:Rha family transcriptional regulator [Xanthobacter agilis]|uniref:Phage regulator Rha-like protein n=1 Tax=Xanthobacter agilis TaxID=47492 RepID=A0ABU0LFP8_XANAG|nr:Rha family transcriptional regulator [Xanthobacter agilis]MDQ0505974.1 phage regulator Rha-like protein [Xanthobacter agilis]